MASKSSIDWSEVIFSLIRANVSIPLISQKLGVTKQAVYKWRDDNSKPIYDNGVQLLALWCEKTGLDHGNIPRL